MKYFKRLKIRFSYCLCFRLGTLHNHGRQFSLSELHDCITCKVAKVIIVILVEKFLNHFDGILIPTKGRKKMAYSNRTKPRSML